MSGTMRAIDISTAFGGVLTVSVGHANPKVNAAVIEQVNKIIAYVRALRESESIGSGGKAGRNHARRFEKIIFYIERHRSRRHGDYGGEARDRQTGNRRSAAQLFGQKRDGFILRPDIRRGDRLPAQVAGIVHARAPYCYRCPFNLTPDKLRCGVRQMTSKT